MDILTEFFQELSDKAPVQGPQDAAKQAAAEAALALVEPGMTLGLGTGSTVDFFLQGLARRMAQGLSVKGVPTSSATERRARELGIPLLEPEGFPCLDNDLCVDGADRVDLRGQLIKGGGGALLREKLVAQNSKQVCILVDPSKMVPVFDQSFPLPVECVQFGIENTLNLLAGMGCEVALRGAAEGQPLLTDNGNFIADCTFPQIPDPQATGLRFKAITGVVEVGIFSSLLDRLVVGYADGSCLQWKGSKG